MKYLLAICVILLSISWVKGQTPLSNWTIERNQTIVPLRGFAYYSIAFPFSTNINYTIWPCYGSVDVYVSHSGSPDAGSNIGAATYNPSYQVAELWVSRPVNPNQPLIAGVQALNQSVTRNFAARFDIVANTLNDTYEYLFRVPQPPADQISISKDIGNNIATVTYTGTGNSRDSYSYYRYNNTWDYNTDLFVSSTACGIREFMEPAYPLSSSVLGNGDVQVQFRVEYDKADFTLNYLSVVVTRDCTDLAIDCYEATYFLVKVNSGALLAPLSLAILLLISILSVLMF